MRFSIVEELLRQKVNWLDLPHALTIDSGKNVDEHAEVLALSDPDLAHSGAEHSGVILGPVSSPEHDLGGDDQHAHSILLNL